MDINFCFSLLFILTLWMDLAKCASHVGYKAMFRENEDSVKRALLMTDPTQHITEPGILTTWDVYANRGRRSQAAFLQVWRAINKEERTFKLIGETYYLALWAGHSHIPLRPDDRIRVMAGDTIGVYFPKYNPIPWTPVVCSGGNEHLYKYNPRGVQVNKTITMEEATSDWKPCRRYSFNATIMSEEEANAYDLDYEETQDGRYQKRPYGPYLPTRDPYLAHGTALIMHGAPGRVMLTTMVMMVVMMVRC